jgi:hypothetical protein
MNTGSTVATRILMPPMISFSAFIERRKVRVVRADRQRQCPTTNVVV